MASDSSICCEEDGTEVSGSISSLTGVTDLFNPEKQKKQKSKKDEFYYNVSNTQPYKKIPNITQKRIDEILDKINQQGYRFLTSEEKDILKRAAEEEDL